jgi:hypothetical protein
VSNAPLAVGTEPPPLNAKPKPAAIPSSADNSNTKGKPNRNAGNRFGVLNAFVDYSLPGLSRGEVATWLVLYRDTKANGIARTSIDDIARRIGANRATVLRGVAKLTKIGMLVIVYRGSMRRGPSAYRVCPLAPTANGNGNCDAHARPRVALDKNSNGGRKLPDPAHPPPDM